MQSLNSFALQQRQAFHGLAPGIIQSRKGVKGSIIVRIKSEGLKDAEIVPESK